MSTAREILTAAMKLDASDRELLLDALLNARRDAAVRADLEARLADDVAHPERARPWAEVRAELQEALRHARNRRDTAGAA